MKVFISYGSASDQVTALRLQALGAVNGLTVYVPPAYTRQSWSGTVDPEVDQKLRDADFVLGIVSGVLSDACRLEVDAGQRLEKRIIVMAEASAVQNVQRHYRGSMVVIDAANPALTEAGIVEQLKTINASQQAEKALIALGTLALGLLIFAPQD